MPPLLSFSFDVEQEAVAVVALPGAVVATPRQEESGPGEEREGGAAGERDSGVALSRERGVDVVVG